MPLIIIGCQADKFSINCCILINADSFKLSIRGSFVFSELVCFLAGLSVGPLLTTTDDVNLINYCCNPSIIYDPTHSRIPTSLSILGLFFLFGSTAISV